MSTTLDTASLAEATVNSLVREHPRTVEVFNRYGIDACCGGAASVRAAAERDGVDAGALVAALREVILP